MTSKTITYTDYNGVERTETFWFNLSKAEVLEMELETAGGLAEKIRKIISAHDVPEIVTVFKDVILSSYGEKSPDGKRFMKKDENGKPLSAAFEETEAFSVLYMELALDAEKASEFVNGVLPGNVSGGQIVPTVS